MDWLRVFCAPLMRHFEAQIELQHHNVIIIKSIGEGGFAFVFLVQDQFRNLFALKQIRTHDNVQFKKALDEIELQGKMSHQNILRLIDHAVVDEGNKGKLVMMLLPYCGNGSLAALRYKMLLEKQFFTEIEVLTMFRAICEGIHYMHTMEPVKYAHRDIKIDNILLDDQNNPIIVDFGSAAPAIVNIENRSQALKLQDWAAENCTM
jgi:serine/threonine kinase 16